MTERFSLKLQDFEGPLDLLLQLIEKRKLHISEVSIAAVADDFIAYLSRLANLPKHETADFLVVASTLMLLKSAALLPSLALTPEEETDAAELERRLKLYQYIQTLSGDLRKRFGTSPLYFREASKTITPIFVPTSEITIQNILATARRLLSSLPKPEIIPEVVVRKIRSLQETIEELTSRLQSALSLKFSDFAPRHREEKVNIIISFLGLLELVRRGMIEVEQNSHFEDINMQTMKPGLPKYL